MRARTQTDAPSVVQSHALEKSFAQISAYLDSVKYVIHALQEEPPDDELVQRALDALTSIRDGMAQGEMFMDLFRDVRDHLVAVLGLNTDLTGQVIGDAAGVNDSYVSRVTKRKMGSTRREHRRSKQGDPPSARTVGHGRTRAAS